MRNATCVRTHTSKVPTRVTLLFIPYTVVLSVKARLTGENQRLLRWQLDTDKGKQEKELNL